MDNLCKVLKKKRDAEQRLRQSDPGKNVIIGSNEEGQQINDPAVQVVAINGLFGTVTLAAGSNVTISEDGQTITINTIEEENPVDVAESKGDIIVFNGANYERVPVGTDGQILAADSAQGNGIKWAANIPSGADATEIDGIPVDLDDQTDGYVLTYDAATEKILLKPKPAGGGDAWLSKISLLSNIYSLGWLLSETSYAP